MELEHLARVQNPLINYLRQRLAWEFPEVVHRNGKTKTHYLPPLFGWVGLKQDLTSKKGWTQIENEYEKSIAPKFGIEISPFTRLHARWLADVHMWEQLMDDELTDLLASVEFEQYQQIFGSFGFGLRTRARLLSRIYPFESFLKTVPGGSSICRQALWLYVLTGVETGRLPETPQTKVLLDYRNYLKSQTDGSGKPLLKGKLIQMKLMAKTTNMLFCEFAKVFRVVQEL